ncbi:uncharacterized protein LOC101860571 [Aplysia californica]|uniref:Uncharacterized protein LOC101860571 n=1 Tax=Aplysia californica TaxID=6500 RepID=A0ABM0JPW1_APLCA|nr:uncharacterized protein LOC101860571 [Aplysia californica]
MSTKSLNGITFDPNEIPISADLVEAARYVLDFLHEVSLKPELYEGPLVECAIQRYERYWLPLVAKHPGRLLPAPLDIEWVWHCHMLAPVAYMTDCRNIVGKLVDHHMIDRTQRKELMKDSERLWRNEYTDVPFSACDAVTPWFDCEFVSALTYNLTSAVSRQKLFYYQVSLPHYRDEKFLNNGLMRYRKFLFLKLHYPGMFLVPCYDNDLIWHTHLLHPALYKDDTEAYLGSLLPHDDSVNDRTAGSKLCLSEAKTRNLWRKVFNEKFSHFGAMFRGEPPHNKLIGMSKEDVYKVCTKQVNVLIEKVRIAGLPPGKTFKLKLCYNTGYQNFNRSLFVTDHIITVKGNSRTLEDNKINTHFSFDTRYNDKLIASLHQKSGRLCLGTSDTLGEGKLDLQKKIQPLNSKGLTANDDINCGDELSIGLVWSCPAPVLGPCVLRLEPGDYQSCVIPSDRESMWGPIPLQRLPAHLENYCSVASHKLFNHTRRVVFTVRMIHSEALLMSAIHVFHGDKMTAVAHLVVGDQLPLPTSVGEPKKCITLNPKEGQRAVLIKNSKGDWGVAVGWWDGYQKRTTGRKGSGSEGHLEIRFYHLPTHRWHYVSFDRLYSLATSKFEIGDCVVEFDSGFIEINSDRCEIAENLALIFSVALIHVLCQPRPSNWAPRLYSTPRMGEEQSSRLGGSEEIALLLAAGVLIATPCNHAIKNLFKKKKQGFGDGSSSSVRRSSSREEEEYDQNGGPAVILHEAEVSAGWGEDVGNRGSRDVSDVALTVGAGLTVISEGDNAEEEEEEETRLQQQREEDEEEENGAEATERTTLLPVVEASDGEAEEEEQTSLREGSREENGNSEAENEEGGRGEEGDNDSLRDSEDEAAYPGDEDNVDVDSQTGLFGNGEDDSDEVDDESPRMSGLRGHSSSGDENHVLENDEVFDRDEPNHDDVLSNHVGYAINEDAGNYYDEFYNINGEESHNGYENVSGPETQSGSKTNDTPNYSSVWDAYGDDAKAVTNDTSIAGFDVSTGHEHASDTNFNGGGIYRGVGAGGLMFESGGGMEMASATVDFCGGDSGGGNCGGCGGGGGGCGGCGGCGG